MDDLTMMQLAVEMAKQASSSETWVNPRVGAVIIKDDEVLATGYHHQFGQKHAEVDAIQQIDNPADLQGATLVVTLEPCAHVGKVSACVDAIVAAGIGRVVVGQGDPNPLVCGQGISKLKAAGIAVKMLHQSVSKMLNPAFHYFFDTGLPYVILKVAQSADGFISKQLGKQTKMTDETADILIHQQRAQVGAILIGSETALTDEPHLTVRHVQMMHSQPIRVILDRRGRLQHASQFFDERTLIYTMNETFANNVEQAILYDGELISVLRDLGCRGIQSVLVEGGGVVLRSFIAVGLWQRLDIYQTMDVFESGVSGISILPGHSHTSSHVGNTVHHVFYREDA